MSLWRAGLSRDRGSARVSKLSAEQISADDRKPIQLAFGDELRTVISKLLADEGVRVALGEKLMEAVQDFARREMDSVEDLENAHFRFVTDAALRQEMAKTFYGARWLYKLGLALLAKDEELGAHVRAQVLDYGAVAEALLSYSIGLGIRRGRTSGDRYKYLDFKTCQFRGTFDILKRFWPAHYRHPPLRG